MRRTCRMGKILVIVIHHHHDLALTAPHGTGRGDINRRSQGLRERGESKPWWKGQHGYTLWYAYALFFSLLIPMFLSRKRSFVCLFRRCEERRNFVFSSSLCVPLSGPCRPRGSLSLSPKGRVVAPSLLDER